VSDARSEALEWEATRRPRAAVAALAAAALTLLGGLLGLNAVERVPDTALVTLVDALDAGAAGRGTLTGGSAVQLVQIAEDPAKLAISRACIALGTIGLLLVLLYLFRAVLHRRAMNRLPVALAATGGVVYAVASVAAVVGLVQLGTTIADAQDKSNSNVQALARDDALAAGAQSFASFAALLLGAGMAIICLNAMRTGLLTRFLGVLGLLLGAIFVLSATPVQLDQPPIIRSFWLLAIGLLLLNRIPGRSELPPAWLTGEATPWPSGRPAPSAPAGRAPAPPAGEPDAPAPTPRAPHPTSKKRRKRRR
jgi:hypothetical protein